MVLGVVGLGWGIFVGGVGVACFCTKKKEDVLGKLFASFLSV